MVHLHGTSDFLRCYVLYEEIIVTLMPAMLNDIHSLSGQHIYFLYIQPSSNILPFPNQLKPSPHHQHIAIKKSPKMSQTRSPPLSAMLCYAMLSPQTVSALQHDMFCRNAPLLTHMCYSKNNSNARRQRPPPHIAATGG